MQLQNSYIFLPSPYKEKTHSKEKQDGVIHFEIGHSFIGFLKKAFPEMSKLGECDNYFKSEYAYSTNIGSNVLDVKFIVNIVVETYYLDDLNNKLDDEILDRRDYEESEEPKEAETE